MNGHLVTIEIGVECGADERVQLDRFTFDQHWLKRLNTETVQRWCAVEQYWVLANHVGQNIPHFGTLRLHHAFGGFDRRCDTVNFQFCVDEWFEQLKRHFLRQPALVQFEFRTHHNYRTARVIDAFAEQVLTEAALFPFQHVGQRFQWALVGAGDDAATAAVIEQCIDRFLQHAFVVTHDDVRCAQLKQAFQTVVTVDNTAVEIVEIGRRETATIQRHEWAEFWWNDRNHFHDHPFRLVARIEECFDNFEALHQFFTACIGGRLIQFTAHRIAQFFQVELLQQFTNRFRTYHRGEGTFTILIEGFVILFFVQQLKRREGRHARIGDNIAFEIQYLLEIF